MAMSQIISVGTIIDEALVELGNHILTLLSGQSKYVSKPTEVAIAAVQFVVAHRHYGIFGEGIRSDH